MYGYEVFHEEIMNTLIDSVHRGTCGHAYLFVGEQGLGRHAAADLLAAALVCETPKTAPCGTCDGCVQAKSGSNPDIVHVQTGDKKSIGVETIRELSKDAYIRPFAAPKKVYILEDADSMTEQAQNGFLKLLEEPPAYAVFILIAQNDASLLQTVLSRCTTVRFAPVSRSVITQYIRAKYPEEEERISFLTRYARGNPGAVDRVIAMPDFEMLRKASAEKLPALLSKHMLSAYAVADFLEEHKEEAELILDFWVDFLRDALMLSEETPELMLNQDLQETPKKIADAFDAKNIISALECVMQGKQMLKKSVKLQAICLNMSFSIKKQLYLQ